MTDEQAVAMMAAQFYVAENGAATKEDAVKEAANFLEYAKGELLMRWQIDNDKARNRAQFVASGEPQGETKS